MDYVSKVMDKRELRDLPKSVVERVLSSLDDFSGDEKVRQARIILRKYFGVFLTNKILKPKDVLDFDVLLSSHKSSMKRDYNIFYSEIFSRLNSKTFSTVVDLGCGVNGFSYPYLTDLFGPVSYVGVEAAGKIVSHTNDFFKMKELSSKCLCVHGDLFDISFVSDILGDAKPPVLVFLFQVVDALENLEQDFSKSFLLELKRYSTSLVVSLPIESLSGKKKFSVRRQWILDFLEENFTLRDDFSLFGERFLILDVSSP